MASVGVKNGSSGGIVALLGPDIYQISLAAQLKAQPGGGQGFECSVCHKTQGGPNQQGVILRGQESPIYRHFI